MNPSATNSKSKTTNPTMMQDFRTAAETASYVHMNVKRHVEQEFQRMGTMEDSYIEKYAAIDENIRSFCLFSGMILFVNMIGVAAVTSNKAINPTQHKISFGLMASLLAVSGIWIATWIGFNKFILPHISQSDRNFEVHTKKLSRQIEKLGPGQEKDALTSYYKDAVATYALERASLHLKESKGQDSVSAAEQRINDALKKGTISSKYATRLAREVQTGSFPEPGFFFEKLEKSYKKLQKKVPHTQAAALPKLYRMPYL